MTVILSYNLPNTGLDGFPYTSLLYDEGFEGTKSLLGMTDWTQFTHVHILRNISSHIKLLGQTSM
jgi:hypothetical protein